MDGAGVINATSLAAERSHPMKLSVKKTSAKIAESDTVVMPLCERKTPGAAFTLPGPLSFVGEQFNLSPFRGKQGDIAYCAMKNRPAVLLCGLGKEDDITPESLRNSAASAAAECLRKNIISASVMMPSIPRPGEREVISALAEGFCLGDYAFTRYKTKKENGDARFGEVIFRSDSEGAGDLLREAEIVCRNTNACRDLVNESSDNCTPALFAAAAKKLAKQRGISCTVFGEADIARMKMGLLQAVSRGSANPPRLVVLKYRGGTASSKSVALVGKGITFDSGGLNLKSAGNIEGMKSDMAGAAACLCAMGAAAELGLPGNITAVIPLAENMLGSRSYKPGDVYRAYNGKTVEIGNTDAEGRLILADALAYTADVIQPDVMIDIATLTGACIVALGEIVAGYLTTDERLAALIFEAGETTGERLWRLPLYKEYSEDIKSDFADMNNVAAGRKAGTIIGGVFLKNFVGKTPWAHIDIAGTSWFSKKRGYRPKYATGYGVRLFIELLKKLNA